MKIQALICLLASSAFAQTYSTNGNEQLAGYIAEALEKNPAVRETFARYRSALQRLPQVSSLPDPVVGVTQFARSPETRVGPQTTMFSISQRFPWFGKLSDREKVAAKEAAVLAEMHETSRSETVLGIKLAYYDLAYVDTALAVTEQEVDLLRHYETLAEARYAQGAGLQQSVVKLQAEITRGLSRIAALRRQRVDAEGVLNTLMDEPAQTPLEKVSLAEVPVAEVDYDALSRRARQNLPEIKAAFLEMERDEKSIHLARKQRWPDVTVGAGFTNVLGRRDPAGREMPPPGNGKNIYNVSVGVNLPIYRRKHNAGVLEATERLLASKESYRNQVNRAELSVRAIGFRLETLLTQISLFEDALLTQAEQALLSSETAYSTGTAGVLDLLDSERVLLEVRLGLAQLRSDYLKSMAEMERAIGSAFPEVSP